MDKLRLAVKSLAFEALELRISEGGPVDDIRGLVDAVRVSFNTHFCLKKFIEIF